MSNSLDNATARALRWAAKQKSVTPEELARKFTGKNAVQWRKLLSNLSSGIGLIVHRAGNGAYRVRLAVHFHSDQPDVADEMAELGREADRALRLDSDMSSSVGWSRAERHAFLSRVKYIAEQMARRR